MRNSFKFEAAQEPRPARRQSLLLRDPETVEPLVMISAGGIRFEARVSEASRQELLVITKKPLPALSKAQRVDVAFQRDVQGLLGAIPGVVHWVYDLPNETHTGILLSSPIPEQYQVSHPSCVRTSIRYKTKITGQLYFPDTGKSSPATVLNYSRDGLCIKVPFSPTSGVAFQFAWEGNCSKPVEGKIRWVTMQPEGTICGCELSEANGISLSGVTP